MKTSLLLSVLLLSGCGAMERTLYTRQVTTQPARIVATNTVWQTNLVTVATPDGPRTNTVVLPVVTYDYAPAVTVTNLAPRPEIAGAIQGAGALPLPFAGTAAALLGWLYSAYASARNKRVSVALVNGVEAFRTWSQSTPEGQKADAKLKDFLIQHQEAAGVLNSVAALVNEHTGNTVL
jgi:hypothetical protein